MAYHLVFRNNNYYLDWSEFFILNDSIPRTRSKISRRWPGLHIEFLAERYPMLTKSRSLQESIESEIWSCRRRKGTRRASPAGNRTPWLIRPCWLPSLAALSRGWRCTRICPLWATHFRVWTRTKISTYRRDVMHQTILISEQICVQGQLNSF